MIFVFDLTSNISNLKRNLLKSPNILDATSLISTKLKITDQEYSIQGEWNQISFNDSNWKEVDIPKHRLISEPEYEIGKYAYYRILLPQKAFKELDHLENQISLALSYIHFRTLEIAINGKRFLTNKPQNGLESIIILPVDEKRDNIISIKGFIQTGNTGIDHRDPIMLGRTAELNELHRASYKGVTVFPLVFILSKGSILFIFALIYLLLKVDRSFEKFLYFGLCTFVEELITGDYFYGPLNFNQTVYLYNFVNIGAVCAVFMFFSDLLNIKRHKPIYKILTAFLILLSTVVCIDALYWNNFVDIASFMKFWNLVMVVTIVYFLPKMFMQDRILSFVILIVLALYLWSALFANNVGLNMKAYGNLLLFFLVAYQTFVLFGREQALLRKQERTLLEQEKDVAIGKTAKLLAHDVRRPLELMEILLNKISTGDANTEFLEAAKRDISFSIANVSYQVSDIINFSKTSKIELHDTSFYKILAASVRQVMTIHPEMNIDLQYKLNSPYKILGNESRLAGALVNLITNAVEAIKEIGGKNKGIIRFSTETKNNQFVFKIYNDGPSIPNDLLNKIFQPLFSSGKMKGTGLGLSSVLKSITDHHGSIEVQNIPMGGVEFTLALKLSNLKDQINFSDFMTSSKDYGYSPTNRTSELNMPKLRLFLLDDDPQAVQYFQHLIQGLPFDVSLTFANDYDSAVDLIHRSRSDLYILDYDLDGDKTGEDFYLEHLSFLSDEVIFHANRDLYNSNDLSCKFFIKPITLFDLTQVCEHIYKTRLRILLVDDTKLIRIAWTSFHGIHNLISASSPEEALDIIKDKSIKIDLCVLDYYYENSSLNGEMLVNEISEIRKDLKIVISSSVEHNLLGIPNISKRNYEVRNLKS